MNKTKSYFNKYQFGISRMCFHKQEDLFKKAFCKRVYLDNDLAQTLNLQHNLIIVDDDLNDDYINTGFKFKALKGI